MKRVLHKIIQKLLSKTNVTKTDIQDRDAQDNQNPNDHLEKDVDDIAENDPILNCEIDEIGVIQMLQEHQQVVFVDIREPFEYRQGYIENALMIPMNEIPQLYTQFSDDLPIILYCAAGIRSFDVCVYLRQKGFQNIFSLEGGVGTWAKHSYVYPQDSNFFVGQMLVMEQKKYIVQHIFERETQKYLRLISYRNFNDRKEILEEDLYRHNRDFVPKN